MLTISDLSGNMEPLVDIKNLKRNRKVNGEKSLSFFVIPTENNKYTYSMVDVESIVEFDNENYVIKMAKERNAGRVTIKEVTAVHKFFCDMIDDYQYDTHTGSLTFKAALDFIFIGTPYSYSIIDSFNAQEFENFGDDNKLSLFKKALERYNAEFEVKGNMVYLKREIGAKTDFQFRYGHNVKTIDKQIDTTNLATYIRGYGKQNEDGTYVVEAEYTSPNVAVLGKRHAPVVRDERFTDYNSLLDRIKSALIDEPQLSITIDFADLRAAGYNQGAPNEGDYGFIIYEPMNLEVEARIVEIEEEIVNTQPIRTHVTLSNFREGMTDLLTRFGQTQKQVDDLFNGQADLPFDVLPKWVQVATQALQSARTELDFNNGIIARDPQNPNRVVLFNSGGIGISDDGGNTFREAITADGFVLSAGAIGKLDANHINAGTLSAISANLGTVETGTLNGVTLNGVTINGSVINTVGVYPDGGGSAQLTDELQIWSNNGGYVTLNPGVLSMYSPSYGSLWLDPNEFRLSGIAKISGATDSGSGSNGYFRHLANTGNYMRLNDTAISFFVNNVKKGEYASLPKFTVEPTVDGDGNYVTDEKTFAVNSMGSMQPAVIDFIRINITGKTKVYLSEKFRDFVGWYDVFPRNAEVIEIQDDYFIIDGQGNIPILIVGVENRKEGIRGYALSEEVIDQHGCENEPHGWCQTKESSYVPIIEEVKTEDIEPE